MSRILPAVVVLAAFALAACAAGQAAPSGLPASPTPTLAASPTPAPTGTPIATPSAAPSEDPTTSPAPTAEGFTPDEQILLDGIRRGARDCEPVRDGLPDGATAGIECGSDDPAVARVGFYRFPTEAAALEAYLARMRAEGVPLETVACIEGEGEGSYVPYEDGVSPMRNGCFVNDEGFANFRATLGGGMYVGVLGTSDDMVALVDYAWKGNQDTPGMPTLWSEPDAPSH
ncbi:MAG TPA: hypothetical protein VF119_04705 [Candidatus Limnocylindrales bacterium]